MLYFLIPNLTSYSSPDTLNNLCFNKTTTIFIITPVYFCFIILIGYDLFACFKGLNFLDALPIKNITKLKLRLKLKMYKHRHSHRSLSCVSQCKLYISCKQADTSVLLLFFSFSIFYRHVKNELLAN